MAHGLVTTVVCNLTAKNTKIRRVVAYGSLVLDNFLSGGRNLVNRQLCTYPELYMRSDVELTSVAIA